MKYVEAIVLSEPSEVDARLAALQLTRAGLLRVRSKSLGAAANATPFHPSNAAGTFGYHYGTSGLREEFVGPNWRLDRPNGVETIRNDTLKLQIAFANVDLACDNDRKPRPRSYKGTGSERVCMGNLFERLPEFAPAQPDGWMTFYLMVDERGAAELTRPIISKGTFTHWPERIYLSDGSDLHSEPLGLDEGDIADDFDPQVIRK